MQEKTPPSTLMSVSQGIKAKSGPMAAPSSYLWYLEELQRSSSPEENEGATTDKNATHTEESLREGLP
jgi:hypothetical protein